MISHQIAKAIREALLYPRWVPIKVNGSYKAFDSIENKCSDEHFGYAEAVKEWCEEASLAHELNRHLTFQFKIK